MNRVIFLTRQYIDDNREWLKFTLQWFLLAAVIGGLTVLIKPDIINKILELFKDKFGPTPDRNITLARQIFLQNSMACLIALVGGVVFGLSSFLILLFNGFIIGFVVISILFIPGNVARNALYVFVGLVPHGIFELPAFFLASAMGLRLGTEWLGKEKSGIRWNVFKQNLKRVLIAFPIIEILLIVAALLEVFVSGKLVGNF